MIQPHSLKDPRLRELVDILIDWLNDELAFQRIIVKHMEEDLFDGMVLHKLLGTPTLIYVEKLLKNDFSGVFSLKAITVDFLLIILVHDRKESVLGNDSL